MTHCSGSTYVSSTAGQWYKFVHTPAKDDTRCEYCYNKLLALGRAGAHGMEPYIAKTDGMINCDTYRRSLSKMVYNDVIVSITSPDGHIPYISYNKETNNMEKYGIYCVEMPNNTLYNITINVKDYLYKYIVKRADVSSTIDTMSYCTNERTLDVMTSDCEPIAIMVFKYTKNLQLTSAATIIIKTIPSNVIIDARLMYQSQELLLHSKLDRLNEYLANANLLQQAVAQQSTQQAVAQQSTQQSTQQAVQQSTQQAVAHQAGQQSTTQSSLIQQSTTQSSLIQQSTTQSSPVQQSTTQSSPVQQSTQQAPPIQLQESTQEYKPLESDDYVAL